MSDPLLLTWDGTTWNNIGDFENKLLLDQDVANFLSKNQNISSKPTEVVQACLIKDTAPSPSPVSQTSQICKLSTLRIKKVGRGYDLLIQGIGGENNILEIISGSSKKLSDIECDILGLVGPCEGIHKNKTFVFSEKFESKTNSSLKFKSRSANLQWKYPWEVKPIEYKILVATCGKSVVGILRVFQDLEINIGVTFLKKETSTTYDETKSSIFEGQKKAISTGKPVSGAVVTKKRAMEEISSEISFGGEIKYDGISIGAKKAFEDVIEKIKQVSKKVEKVKESIYEIKNKAEVLESLNKLRKKANNAVSILNPSLSIDLKGRWEEIKGDYKCDYNVILDIHASPFIGISADIELVGFLFSKSPVGLIKELLDKVDIDALSLRLTVGAQIDGNLTITFYRVNKTKVEGKITGKIPFELKAILVQIDKEKELLSWKFAIKGELSVTLKTGVFAEISLSNQERNLSLSLGIEETIIVLTAKISSEVVKTNRVKIPPPGYHSQQNKNAENAKAPMDYEIYRIEKIETDPITIFSFNK